MLMTFSEILRNDLARKPGEQQALAVKLFPVAVRGSNFELWTSKNAETESRQRVVIGVATYVPAELSLLDQINERLPLELPMVIEVFNVLDCANQKDVETRVPGLAMVHQTPVVGLWENREFRRSEQGARARELLLRLLD